MSHPKDFFKSQPGNWISVEQALHDAAIEREAQMMQDARDDDPNELIERELASIERLERKRGDSK